MNKIIEVQGKKYLTTEDSLQPGDSYVFATKEKPDEWCFGEQYLYFPDAGGRNVVEVLNPTMTRRKVILIVK
jgi:hypothetical protein